MQKDTDASYIRFLKLPLQHPRRPRWKLPDYEYGQAWDATYFRPACPQRIEEIWKDIPSFPKKNISEDCLYMNIFAPNVSKIQYNFRLIANVLNCFGLSVLVNKIL